MAKKVNPLEEMVEEFADIYVDLVYELAEELAPVRPWWHADLSPDAQLWRWQEIREDIMPWLVEALVHMGFTDPREAMAHIGDVFTSQSAVDLIPPAHVASIPLELLEMVQASGPEDAAKHIRKMERMVVGRIEALTLLDQPDQPDVEAPWKRLYESETAPETEAAATY